ncbi:unnamed protein product [marine sediment metagenome]|uniref:Uncharacterized protein n=1 Tax=marine sediment metagenome TaxID=412755 RepID=X0U4R6_9ZZZZ
MVPSGTQLGPNWAAEWDGTITLPTDGPASRWVGFWHQNTGHLTFNGLLNLVMEGYGNSIPSDAMYWSIDQMRARYELPTQIFVDLYTITPALLALAAITVTEHKRQQDNQVEFGWHKIACGFNGALRQGEALGFDTDPTDPVYTPV